MKVILYFRWGGYTHKVFVKSFDKLKDASAFLGRVITEMTRIYGESEKEE